jgi:urea carboxylase
MFPASAGSVLVLALPWYVHSCCVLNGVDRGFTQCDYDFNIISQAQMLDILIAAEKAVPEDVTGMSFPARRITFPVVLDDRWNREALERYMATIRKKAVYLPSNIDYLARNNGLSSGTEMLEKMVASDWVRPSVPPLRCI